MPASRGCGRLRCNSNFQNWEPKFDAGIYSIENSKKNECFNNFQKAEIDTGIFGIVKL